MKKTLFVRTNKNGNGYFARAVSTLMLMLQMNGKEPAEYTVVAFTSLSKARDYGWERAWKMLYNA